MDLLLLHKSHPFSTEGLSEKESKFPFLDGGPTPSAIPVESGWSSEPWRCECELYSYGPQDLSTTPTISTELYFEYAKIVEDEKSTAKPWTNSIMAKREQEENKSRNEYQQYETNLRQCSSNQSGQNQQQSTEPKEIEMTSKFYTTQYHIRHGQSSCPVTSNPNLAHSYDLIPNQQSPQASNSSHPLASGLSHSSPFTAFTNPPLHLNQPSPSTQIYSSNNGTELPSPNTPLKSSFHFPSLTSSSSRDLFILSLSQTPGVIYVYVKPRDPSIHSPRTSNNPTPPPPRISTHQLPDSIFCCDQELLTLLKHQKLIKKPDAKISISGLYHKKGDILAYQGTISFDHSIHDSTPRPNGFLLHISSLIPNTDQSTLLQIISKNAALRHGQTSRTHKKSPIHNASHLPSHSTSPSPVRSKEHATSNTTHLSPRQENILSPDSSLLFTVPKPYPSQPPNTSSETRSNSSFYDSLVTRADFISFFPTSPDPPPSTSLLQLLHRQFASSVSCSSPTPYLFSKPYVHSSGVYRPQNRQKLTVYQYIQMLRNQGFLR